MECAKCHSGVAPDAAYCGQCGAKLAAPVPAESEDFVFESGGEASQPVPEDGFELGEAEEPAEWEIPPEAVPATEWQAAAREFKQAPEKSPPPEVRRGGFFRRAAAFLVDCAVLTILAAIMGVMSYIAYKVGLAAYHRPVTEANAASLAAVLIFATMVLTTGYFSLFHGMDGQTVGKWLLDLRVVGPNYRRIGYRRALWRWLWTVIFAPFLLGFLWVLWSREKRAWHDYLARTWVIRE